MAGKIVCRVGEVRGWLKMFEGDIVCAWGVGFNFISCDWDQNLNHKQLSWANGFLHFFKTDFDQKGSA